MAPKKLPVSTYNRFLQKKGYLIFLRHRVDFEAVAFLDLFSGTGNISYEFGSRGTEDITSVDAHYGCVKYINTISEELDFSYKNS